jgi:hypothetical protein
MRIVQYNTVGVQKEGYFHDFCITDNVEGQQSLCVIVEDVFKGNVLVLPYTSIKFIDHLILPRECLIGGVEGYSFHKFVTLNTKTFGIVEKEGRIICVIPQKIQFKRD